MQRILSVGLVLAGLMVALGAPQLGGGVTTAQAQTNSQQRDAEKDDVAASDHVRVTWVCVGSVEDENLKVNVFNASSSANNRITDSSKFYEADGDSFDVPSTPLDSFETVTIEGPETAVSAIFVVTSDRFLLSAHTTGPDLSFPCTAIKRTS